MLSHASIRLVAVILLSFVSPLVVAQEQTATIIGRVNDQVILREEILEAVRAQLDQAKKQLPEEQYKKFEESIIRQALDVKIQRIVVMKELELRVPDKAVIPKIREQGNKEFEKNLLERGRSQGFQTREEIVAQLEAEGSNLAQLRKDFVDNWLAQGYLAQLVRNQVKEPNRAEMYQYYEENPQEFADPAGVVWRHIQIGVGADPDSAYRKIQQAYRRLLNGEDFGELAKRFSDGATASDGGLWPKTSKGSFAEPVVDEALFDLAVGKPSDILRGKNAFHLVLVERRSDGTPKAFSEVQDVIRNKLRNNQLVVLKKTKVKELMSKHHIESVFDQPAARTADRGTATTKQ